MLPLDLITVTDCIGIAAFAFAGILAADGKKVDPVGVFVLAFTTAFGGGLFRDIIIDNRPFYWIENQLYVWMTLALAAFAPLLVRKFKKYLPMSLFIWSDAVGLGFFSIGGTTLSLEAGIPYLASAILGVCTGVLGGIIRDVLLNQVPMVLSDKLPYASAAFIGSWIYIGLLHVGADPQFSMWFCTAAIIFGRMYCWYNGLAIIRYPGTPADDGTLDSSVEPDKDNSKKP